MLGCSKVSAPGLCRWFFFFDDAMRLLLRFGVVGGLATPAMVGFSGTSLTFIANSEHGDISVYCVLRCMGVTLAPCQWC